MFSFKIFLLFRVRVTGEKVTEKEGILARERQFQQLVLVLAKYGKINDVQVVGSTVTAVLKRLFQLSRKAMTTIMKKLSQLSGKAVTAIMKKLSQLSGKAVRFGQNPMRLKGWFQTTGEAISTFIGWIWLKNGKISLKGVRVLFFFTPNFI